MIKNLVRRTRSYRRFNEQVIIPVSTLRSFVDAARLTASAQNLQPIKYALVNHPDLDAEVFETLSWAGYLADWDGPEKGERPTGYVVMLGDTSISDKFDCDSGIAGQTIMLSAAEAGYGGCIIRSIDRAKLTAVLKIPDHLTIIQVIALGEPAEKVVIEDAKNDDIKYWRDQDGLHHVPKRVLDELIVCENLNRS